MKRISRSATVAVALAASSMVAAAQSSLTLTGVMTLDVARGNGGTSPLYGSGGTKVWTMNDIVSHLNIDGKEDLGDGAYAGFSLQHFFLADTGQAANQTANTFFDGRSSVKLGGRWGQVYAGREYSPIFYTAVLSDPWLWDTSLGQIGYLQFANYWSTSGVRTDNTVGYVSPTLQGVTLRLAVSAGEGAPTGRDTGGSATYADGPVWTSVAFDQHKNANGIDMDRLVTAAAAYDFNVIKPSALYSRSRVAGASYSAYSLAFTMPIREQGSLRGAISRISDWDTATSGEQSLVKTSLGYLYYLSKRTNLFTSIASSKGEGATRTSAVDAGITHNF